MSWNSNLNPDLIKIINQVDEKIMPVRRLLQEVALTNQGKVLEAFRNNKLSESHFAPSTGYGYDDIGRDALESIYADVFKTESALVRPQIVSGTHAIATALFGVLRPNDELIYITGTPYDTLHEVIGTAGNGIGSLKEYGISYQEVLLKEDGTVDFEEVKRRVSSSTKVIGIQRSRGYDSRPSFTVKQISEMIAFIKEINSELIVFVDNCYGEFAEIIEPTEVGADLMAGSLIKNPGGGIAKTGGYIVGKKDLVEKAGYRLTTPGVGSEGGAMIYSTHEMIQGFFLAPHVVSQAIQGAVFTAALLEEFSIESTPRWDEPRTDLIQLIALGDKDKMIAFCQSIQKYSPVDAYVAPIPAYMPGYEDDVIMAAGTFIQGASLELTADGPIREPYKLYVQGGLTFEHVKIAVSEAVNETFY